jgi:hypothetical protein
MLLVQSTGRETRLDPFKPWINRRWNEGLTSAAALHAEIATQGRAGGAQAVERYVRQFRTADGRTRAGRNPRQARQPRRPPRPARPPPGCSPAPTTSAPPARHDSPPPGPGGARTWTPWPGTSAASPT